MIRLRPYKATDAKTVLSWCRDERAFYQWTAGVLGSYPLPPEKFFFGESLMPFIAFDERGPVGFFTLRTPEESLEELRVGFVIVDPNRRGTGCGKEMLRLGLKFAFDLYGAEKVSLGVFENNLPAYHCYKAVGFQDALLDKTETYHVLGEIWKCKELNLNKEKSIPDYREE